MIHYIITFVAITNLHLAFGTSTMDTYSTDATIWSQTETTTDPQNHSSGTAYRQRAATNTPESFSNLVSTVQNELNVSLENLVSAFDKSSYDDDYGGFGMGFETDEVENDMHDEEVPLELENDIKHSLDPGQFNYAEYDEEVPRELYLTLSELYAQFNTLIEPAVRFICTAISNVSYDVISTSRTYVHNCTEFMVGLNGSTAAIGEVSVDDTVADLYRTVIQQVESMMELVEHLTEMVSGEVKFYEIGLSIFQQLEVIKLFNLTSELEIAVGKQKELVNLLQNISERAGNMSEHTDGNPFINVTTSGRMSRFVDAQYWAEILDERSQMLVTYRAWLREVQHAQFVMYKVTPVIMAIFVLVGITGNGLLLAIFVRHKETRTLANCMLINLTLVDFLSLIVNLLLDYLRVTTPWHMGWLDCKLFTFFGYLLMAVSTYSVAMLSFKRFMAVWQLRSLDWCHQSQKTKYVLIATVWGIGCIVSVPHAVFADIDSKTETCKVFSFKYRGPMDTADLIVFCAVPLLITAVFSGLTAYRIRRSVREIPGEATEQQHLQHSRMVSSTVLFALTVLFVVTYVPDFLFQFLIFGVGISVTIETFTLVNVVTFCLRFVNCCLNPIVLFVMTKRYRGYIKRYCGQREVQSAMRVKEA